jgi:hypothetical protein
MRIGKDRPGLFSLSFKRSPCKRYINLTGISNLMKERSANVANYKCCKLPEMLPT